MNSYQKAACSLIRLVAAGLIVIGMMLGGLEILNHRAKGVEISYLKITFDSVMFIAGVGLFAVSNKLAARLTGEDESDDTDDSGTPGE
jgi:hypothetical protein